MEFSHDLAMILYKSTDPFPVDLEDAVKWVGWTRKSSAKTTLTNNFREGVDFYSPNRKSPTGGRPKEVYLLTVQCFKKLAMMAETEQGDRVRDYFIECERIAHSKVQAIAVIGVTDSIQIVDAISTWLIQAKVDESIASMWKLDQLGRRHPELKPETESAKQLIGGANATDAQYLTPTGLGDRLGMKSRAVNAALAEAGLQKQTEDAKGKKKWDLTDEGKKYGIVFLVSGQSSRWSGGQIKWLPSVIELLKVQQTA
jgi:phage anti-repressor protein